MPEAARKYEPAPVTCPAWQEAVRCAAARALARTRQAAPGSDMMFDELFISLLVAEIRPVVAARVNVAEMRARQREDAAYASGRAAGLTARTRALRVVPGC